MKKTMIAILLGAVLAGCGAGAKDDYSNCWEPPDDPNGLPALSTDPFPGWTSEGARICLPDPATVDPNSEFCFDDPKGYWLAPIDESQECPSFTSRSVCLRAEEFEPGEITWAWSYYCEDPMP